MNRNPQRARGYKPSPLSRQLSCPNFPNLDIDGRQFNTQPNVCTCAPQPCNIPTGDIVDHNSIYIHYLAMMQSLGISGPSELQSILSEGGGKPELTAQLKTSLSRWLHLGWLKADTIPSGDRDTLGQEPFMASGTRPDEPITDIDTILNDSPQHAERIDLSKTDPDDEVDGGPLTRQYTYHDMYFKGDVYDDYRGGPRGHAMYAEDFSDSEDTYEFSEKWYSSRRGGRGCGG